MIKCLRTCSLDMRQYLWQIFILAICDSTSWCAGSELFSKLGVPSSHDKERMATGWNQLSPGPTGSAEHWFSWGYPTEVYAGVKNSCKRKKQYLESRHWFFLSYAREMFDLQRPVSNWKRWPWATEEGLTLHTWEAATQQQQQDHGQIKLLQARSPVFSFAHSGRELVATA